MRRAMLRVGAVLMLIAVLAGGALAQEAALFTLPDGVGDVTLRLDEGGVTLQLLGASGAELQQWNLAELVSLEIRGNALDNFLTVDAIHGDPIPAGGLTWNGGVAAFDGIRLENINVTSLTTTHHNAHDGVIELTTGTLTSRIVYQELEPLTMGGTAADVVFDLPGTADQAQLQEDGTPANGMSLLFSNNIPATFEATTFADPTNSLTINMGNDGGILAVFAVPELTATLNVNGEDGDDLLNISVPRAETTNFDGGVGDIDTLSTTNMAETFMVTAGGTGTVSGAINGSFTEVESILSQGGDDSFIFSNGVNISGLIDGGLGTDSADYSGWMTPFTAELSRFAGIESLTGGQTTDTLQLNDNGQAVVVNAANAGTVDGGLAFSSFENILGGTGDDSLTFSGTGSLSDTFNGGGGNDTLTARDDAPASFAILANNAGIVENLISGFNSVENLIGTSFDDSFTFSNGVNVTGTIDGQGGTDTANYSAWTTALTVDLNRVLNFEQVLGGTSAGDTLQLRDTGQTATITGANQGTVDGTNAYQAFENLTGGTGSDAFTLGDTGSLSGSLNGGDGTDSLTGRATIANAFVIFAAGGGMLGGLTNGFAGIETLIGGGADDTFTLSGSGSLAGSIDGAAGGNDRIAGANLPNAFGITGLNSGTHGSITGGFTNIEGLDGGAAVDTFTLVGAGSLSGSITGGLGADRLVGSDAGATFTISGSDAGSVAAIGGGFTSIENITGGSGVDTFLLGATGSLSGTLNGGDGSDTLAFTSAATVVVTGANQGTVAALSGGFTNIESLTGGVGNDSFTLGAGTLDGAIDGGGGTDTLTGVGAGGTFTVTALDAGSTTGLTGGFTNIENLVGGGNTDTFTLSTGGTLSGSVNGGAGADTLTGDNVTNAFTVTGTNSGTATGVTGGFTAVESLGGGSLSDTFTLAGGTLAGSVNGGGGTDTLVADNMATGFVLTGANAGSATGLGAGFSNVENLTGGTADDSFTLGAGTLSGAINGGTGIDTLTAVDAGGTFTVTAVNAGNTTGLTGGFTSIENLTGSGNTDTFTLSGGGSLSGSVNGGAGTDTLNGDNVLNSFTVTVVNGGSATGIGGLFSGIENLAGNSQSDSFSFAGGTLAGSVNGNGGTDTIVAGGTAATFVLTGNDAGTSNLAGTGFTSIENLTGGSASDSFTLGAFSLSGAIDGGSGTDTLNGVDGAGTYVVTALNAGTATGVGSGFANVENLAGGSANDTFTLNGGTLAGSVNGGAGTDSFTGGNVASAYVLTGANAGTATGLGTGFAAIENLNGGTDADIFTLGAGSLAGAINGGTGNDTLTGVDAGGAFVVNAANAGTTTGLGGGFTAIESLSGGAGTDTFTLAGGALTGSVNGGGGTDTLIGDNVAGVFTVTAANAGTATGVGGGYAGIENLTGGSADDAFQLTGGTLAGSVNGGAGIDTFTGGNVATAFALTGANAGTATGLGTGFTNIENLFGGSASDAFTLGSGTLGGSVTGGAGSDTLTGVSGAGTFVLTGADTGTATGLGGTYAQIENLAGAAGADTFTIDTGTLSGTIDGGNGNDTLASVTTPMTFVVTGANAGTATGIGGGFSNIENLTGSSGDDTFTLNGGGLSGAMSGGAGTDTLRGDNGNGVYVITGTNAGLAPGVGGGFTGIENLTAGSGNDSITVNSSAGLSGALDAGAGDDAVLINLDSSAFTGTMAGGAGDDRVNFSRTGAGALASTFATGFENAQMAGGGTYQLTGDHTYATRLDVGAASGAGDATTVRVDGTVTSQLVRVNPTSTLRGNGLYHGQLDVAAGAFIAPGNSIGTMTVDGVYTQAGELEIELNAAGQFDRIVVTGNPGTATLAPTSSVRIVAEPGAYQAVTRFNFLTATGGIIGTFGSITDNQGTLDGQFVYTANGVLLVVRRNDITFTGPGFAADTPNNAAVATTLAQIFANGELGTGFVEVPGDMVTIIEQLRLQNAAGLNAALHQISPETYAGETQSAVTAHAQMQRSISRELERRRSRRATPAVPVPTAESGDGRSAYPVASAVAGDGRLLRDGGNDVWASAFGFRSEIDASLGVPEVEQRTSGFSVGYNHRIDHEWLIGAAFSYADTDVTHTAALADSEIDSRQGSLYASYLTDEWYADAILMYTDDGYRSRRSMNFGTIARANQARFDGDELGLYTEVGFRGQTEDGLEWQPHFSLYKRDFHQDALTESGAGALDLAVAARDLDLLQAGLGVRLFQNFELEAGGDLIPELRLKYAHELDDLDRTVTASFVGSPRRFTVAGPRAERGSLQITAGATGYLKSGVDLSLFYFGDFNDGQTSHAANAAVAVRF